MIPSALIELILAGGGTVATALGGVLAWLRRSRPAPDVTVTVAGKPVSIGASSLSRTEVVRLLQRLDDELGESEQPESPQAGD